jgi:hypothetical protein
MTCFRYVTCYASTLHFRLLTFVDYDRDYQGSLIVIRRITRTIDQFSKQGCERSLAGKCGTIRSLTLWSKDILIFYDTML